MSTYKNHALVKKCLLRIEEKLGWGDATEWHSDVFIELSEVIQEKTNVLLSPTTLKRVWGKVNYTNAPSISTLNTLSQFAGYLNWRDFKNKVEDQQTSKTYKFEKDQKKIFAYAAIIALVFISLFSVINGVSDKLEDFDFSALEFESRPIVKGLPNSVVFDFNLKGLDSDSIYIQQYWDVTKTIKLEPNQSQATGQYYYPGYFRAKLLVEGDIKKEHDLFIKSEGWLGTIDYEPIPKYFKTSEIIGTHLKLPDFALLDIQNMENPVQSSFHLVDDFGEISGDNFLLETAFRNSYKDKWAVCQTTKIVILGTKGAMIIPFSIPGCVSDINVLLNDVYLNGKQHDLSAFGTDLSDFKDIQIQTENKTVKVIIDGETRFMKRYNVSIGHLVGIRFRFLGAGEVDYLKLTDSSNKILVDTDFKSK
ncbi:hypothetical protein [uncultured Psychroserpens sp.]|uniref:hypothetical protein n=1 Tax=uncultured Psychroserpens sp. TaxID=255436 RepID=UPI0026046D75|nr:hypothetical protein [uncultured Psychroserpens sp.]